MKFLKKTTGETKKFLVCPLPHFFYKKRKKIVYCPIICLQNTFVGLLTAQTKKCFWN